MPAQVLAQRLQGKVLSGAPPTVVGKAIGPQSLTKLLQLLNEQFAEFELPQGTTRADDAFAPPDPGASVGRIDVAHDDLAAAADRSAPHTHGTTPRLVVVSTEVSSSPSISCNASTTTPGNRSIVTAVQLPCTT